MEEYQYRRNFINSLNGGKGVVKSIKYINPNGGNNEEVEIPVNGFISMAPDAGAVTVDSFGGTHIVSYDHDNTGTDVAITRAVTSLLKKQIKVLC